MKLKILMDSGSNSKYLSILILSIFLSCIDNNNSNSPNKASLEISLLSVIDNDFQFKDFLYTDFPVFTMEKKYPKLYQKKLESIKNYTELDSFMIVSIDMQSAPRDYYRYINGYMPLKDYKDRYKNQLEVDTIAIKENNGINYQLNVVSGFSGNKQILIPDLNNNKSFDDDPKLFFPIDFDIRNMSSREIKDSLPILNFHYQLLADGKIHDVNRKVQIFPHSKHRHSYLMNQDLDEVTNKYTLMLRIKDYKRGKISKDNIDYVFAIQGKNEIMSIIIKPDSIKYKSDNLFMHNFFKYQTSDTIKLGEKWYKIKSVTPDYSKLSLELSNSKPKTRKEKLDFNIPVNDIELNDLNGKTTSLFKQMNKKKYAFLDFWGTWCSPCKELTPKIVDMHNKYGDKVQFISIALDEDRSEVKQYVNNNSMNWFHAFVNQRSRVNTIISKWDISIFPTFILIDSTGKILIGGNSESLEDIDNIIKNLQ